MMMMLSMNLRNEDNGLEFVYRLFDADESGNIELDEMFEIVATFYDMEVKIFVTQAGKQKYLRRCFRCMRM